jgi:hypothetical protein
VPTGRFTTYDNRRRVNPETLTIGPHPANRRLHVVDLGRPWRLIHDAVFSGDTDVATLGQADAKALFDGRTVGGLPPTPRQKEQSLNRTWGIDWPEDIDVQRTPDNVLNDHIFFHADVRHRPLLVRRPGAAHG